MNYLVSEPCGVYFIKGPRTLGLTSNFCNCRSALSAFTRLAACSKVKAHSLDLRTASQRLLHTVEVSAQSFRITSSLILKQSSTASVCGLMLIIGEPSKACLRGRSGYVNPSSALLAHYKWYLEGSSEARKDRHIDACRLLDFHWAQ